MKLPDRYLKSKPTGPGMVFTGICLDFLQNIPATSGTFKHFRGKSLVNTLPPTLPMDERRIDLVEGMETGVSFYHQTLGLILMRNSNPYEKDNFYSLLVFRSSYPDIYPTTLNMLTTSPKIYLYSHE